MDQVEMDAIARTKELRYKRFYESSKELTPRLDRELCFFTPREVMDALNGHPVVKEWQKWLLDEFVPPEREIAILFPDSERKPWTRDETSDRTYKNLHIAIKSLKLEERVHILSVSTLLGIIPEERFTDMPMYETGGMFSWSVKKRGLDWDAMAFRDALARLGEMVSHYLDKHGGSYQKVVAIYRTPSVHERIVANAYDIKPFKLVKSPTKKPLSKSYSDLKDMLKKAI
jgi:predicted RNA-binding protein